MTFRSHSFVPWLLLLQLAGPVRVAAQVDRTAMTGTVTDQQGNRVPQCAVRATETPTGFARETLTTMQGSYELSGLPPGMYTVRFLKSGFATFAVDNVIQVVGQKRTLNARLEVARGQEQTTVTEPLVQIDKVDATIGAAIEHTQIDTLPINGRNWATLTAPWLQARSIMARAIKGQFGLPATDWMTTT